MTIEIALFMVALVLIVFATLRVIARARPTAVRDEARPQPVVAAPRRPHYEPRRPRHFALPPVTIETTPINFKQMVPPIDRTVLAALVASGSRSAAELPQPEKLARGSIALGCGYASDLDDGASDLDAETLTRDSDFDGAETYAVSDLDDDALTRTNMSPVR